MVSAVIIGKMGAARVELIFDSGCAKTQFHIPVLKSVGYSFENRKSNAKARGITGTIENGYEMVLKRFHLLSKTYRQPTVFAFDLSNWAKDGIDGLLGWDIIQKMDFEVLGIRKIIKVY